MGSPGIKFEPEKLYKDNNFIEVYEKFQGVVTDIAKFYKVARLTIYNYINSNPEIKRQTEIIISNVDYDMLDQAGSVTRRCMDMCVTDPGLALAAARLTYNNVGYLRNYASNAPVDKNTKLASDIETFTVATDKAYDAIKQNEAGNNGQ